VKVAAYQAPLLAAGSMDALGLIRRQIDRCESLGVEILCCPEAILGGSADYSAQPSTFAIDVDAGQLNDVLAPLASDTVTTILGFTETDRFGRFYNSAAVFHKGSVIGLYRKLHPAINTSVYSAGCDIPVFTARGLTFGVIICRDSNFPEPAKIMASRGATALFVPTNNGLPFTKASSDIVLQARQADVARATENRVSVIRADVAGQTRDLLSHGSSGIVNPHGVVLGAGRQFSADLVVADIETAPHGQRRGSQDIE
jgi:predicted amidohydrolase